MDGASSVFCFTQRPQRKGEAQRFWRYLVYIRIVGIHAPIAPNNLCVSPFLGDLCVKPLLHRHRLECAHTKKRRASRSLRALFGVKR